MSDGEISVKQLPMRELQLALEELEQGSYYRLSDEELRQKIRALHTGFKIEAPCFYPGLQIFRAVGVRSRPTHKRQVSYPPREFVKANGRLNRAGEVMFYGATNLFTCLLECGCKPGDIFAVSSWQTVRPLLFNHLGYSTEVLEASKALRELPKFANFTDLSEANDLLRRWQARVFTQRVAAGEEARYRLPIALRDHALAEIGNQPDGFAGVIYPSVAMFLLSDNFAILPSYVDSSMKLFEVLLIVVDDITEQKNRDGSARTSYNIKTYDVARPDDNDELVWGQNSQVIYPLGIEAREQEVIFHPPVCSIRDAKFEFSWQVQTYHVKPLA